MSESRTFLSHELRRVREATARRALGGDQPVAAAAAEGAADAEGYLSMLIAADSRPEFAQMVQKVRDRRDVSWLQPERIRRWDAHRDALLALEYHADDEMAASQTLVPLLWSALVADRVVALGVPDLDQRIERLRSPATAERLQEAFIDEVIAHSVADDRSVRIKVLRAYLIAVRLDLGPDLSDVAGRLTKILDADPDLAQEVVDEVLVDGVVAGGSIRRALLNLPSLVRYLEGAMRNARTSRGRRWDREVEIEAIDAEPTSGNDPAGLVIESERAGELRDFVATMPPAMRDDFVAVRLQGRRAAEVAVESGRSAAAVSKNIKAADDRLRTFLVDRG